MQGTANGICSVQSSNGVGFFPPQCTVLIYRMKEVRESSRGSFKAAAMRDPLTPLLQPLTLPCGPPTPVQWVLGLFPRVKRLGQG